MITLQCRRSKDPCDELSATRRRIPSFPLLPVLLLGLLAVLRAVTAHAILRPRDYVVHDTDSLSAFTSLSLPHYDSSTVLDYRDPASVLARILIPRAVGSQNLTNVQNIIRTHFTDLGTTLLSSSTLDPISTWEKLEDTFSENTPEGPKTFTNLVFTHDPRAEKKFVLAAHVDSKYFATAPDNGFVGATDSAVPCGIMMDVASALTPALDELVRRWESEDENEKPSAYSVRTTLQLVFFDGEEAFRTWTNTDSIYGARHLASMWDKVVSTPSPTVPQRSPISQITELVLLDLLGTANPFIRNFFAETGWLYDSLVDVENRLGAAGLLYQNDASIKGEMWKTEGLGGAHLLGERGRSFFEKRVTQFSTYAGRIEDDHLPFMARGVPILHLIPVP